jgi:homoaconitase/3-isopropylmalate dehydratase large subunit
VCEEPLVGEVNEKGAKTEAVEGRGVVVAVVCVLGMETGQGKAEEFEGSLLRALFASAFDALEYIFVESVVLWIVLE